MLSIAMCFSICVIAPKIQELILLVLPLKDKSEIHYLIALDGFIPSLICKGGIVLMAIFHKNHPITQFLKVVAIYDCNNILFAKLLFCMLPEFRNSILQIAIFLEKNTQSVTKAMINVYIQ
jgi:hypothetical protein